MLKIVADQNIPFLKGVLEPFARMIYLPGSKISARDVADADALIVRTRTKCNASLLKGSKVRFIASATIGYDHIDTAYCDSNNIRWTNAPGCNSASVAQYVSSALAVISHQLIAPLHQNTIGIIGAGNVGTKVERIADLLGMRILINDPPREQKEGGQTFTDLDTLLKESDIVSLHTPLETLSSNNTFHLANNEFFQKMKKGAWFINTSRGEVTDSNALLQAIKSHQLAGAVLDVWENEPLISTKLLKEVNIATPHIAGYSADGKANGTALSVQALSKFFGLGLAHWYPENIPAPEGSPLSYICTGKKRQDVFRELSLATYNIVKDSEKLKEKPRDFEKFREDYPTRREPAGYQVKAFDCSELLQKFMLELGFKVST